MKASMRVTGTQQVRLALRNIADRVPKNAARTIRRSGEIIEQEAKLNAPEDFGSLEKSIKRRENYGARGRLNIEIYVDGSEPVLGRYSMITVDRYAWIVHELYDHYVASGEWTPSAQTRAKMANGRHVGSFFLTRAAEDEEPRMRKKAIAAIQGVIDEEMGR